MAHRFASSLQGMEERLCWVESLIMTALLWMRFIFRLDSPMDFDGEIENAQELLYRQLTVVES